MRMTRSRRRWHRLFCASGEPSQSARHVEAVRLMRTGFRQKTRRVVGRVRDDRENRLARSESPPAPADLSKNTPRRRSARADADELADRIGAVACERAGWYGGCCETTTFFRTGLRSLKKTPRKYRDLVPRQSLGRAEHDSGWSSGCVNTRRGSAGRRHQLDVDRWIVDDILRLAARRDGDVRRLEFLGIRRRSRSWCWNRCNEARFGPIAPIIVAQAMAKAAESSPSCRQLT